MAKAKEDVSYEILINGDAQSYEDSLELAVENASLYGEDGDEVEIRSITTVKRGVIKSTPSKVKWSR